MSNPIDYGSDGMIYQVRWLKYGGPTVTWHTPEGDEEMRLVGTTGYKGVVVLMDNTGDSYYAYESSISR